MQARCDDPAALKRADDFGGNISYLDCHLDDEILQDVLEIVKWLTFLSLVVAFFNAKSAVLVLQCLRNTCQIHATSRSSKILSCSWVLVQIHQGR